MKKKKFIVDFGDDKIRVSASNKRDAKILAKAKRIKQGKTHKIKSVENVTTNSIFRMV